MPSDPIQDWTKDRTFSPRMEATVGATPAAALDALERSLRRHRYRVRRRTERELTAVYANWVGVVLGLVTASDASTDRTVLEVSAEPDGHGTRLIVDARGRTESRRSRTLARDALNEAFDALRSTGSAVEASPWRRRPG